MRTSVAHLTCLFGILCLANPIQAATLVLQSPGSSTTASGYHVDLYLLPTWLISTADPVTRISVTLQGSGSDLGALNANPGGAATPLRDASILGPDLDNDTHLLFTTSQIASITGVVETPSLFTATVDFNLVGGITAVSGDVALRVISLDGHGLTSCLWVLTYQSGQTASFDTGIIPEPSAMLYLAGGSLALFGSRRRR